MTVSAPTKPAPVVPEPKPVIPQPKPEPKKKPTFPGKRPGAPGVPSSPPKPVIRPTFPAPVRKPGKPPVPSKPPAPAKVPSKVPSQPTKPLPPWKPPATRPQTPPKPPESPPTSIPRPKKPPAPPAAIQPPKPKLPKGFSEAAKIERRLPKQIPEPLPDAAGAGGKLAGGGRWIGRGLTVLSGLNLALHWWGVYKDWRKYQESQRIPLKPGGVPDPRFKWDSNRELNIRSRLQYSGEARCEPIDSVFVAFHNDFGTGNDFSLKEGFHPFTGVQSFDASAQIANLPYPLNQRKAEGDTRFDVPDSRMLRPGEPPVQLTQRPPTSIVMRMKQSGTSNAGAWTSMAESSARYYFRVNDDLIIDVWSVMVSYTIDKRTMRENNFDTLEFAAGYYDWSFNRIVFSPEYEIS